MDLSPRGLGRIADALVDEGDGPAADAFVSPTDSVAFRDGLTRFENGTWEEVRWTTFRLRFGVYKERRPGLHMLRVKVPGGRVTTAQARALAQAAKAHGDGAVHITTRQGFQLYGIAQDALAPLIEALAEGGLTTREASGNTFRAVCACPYAGVCPRERVDAGAVAERLTASWIRHPLVQHMPRKFKTSVSGCAHDCAGVAFDDLGFIAIEHDGKPGFKVLAGGGLGAKPRQAIVLFDFVTEDDLSAVQEAVARVHNAHSDRKRKHAARIKALVERLGEADFVRLVHREYAWIHGLPRRPQAPLSWREPEAGSAPAPSGGFTGSDGREVLTLRPSLGWLSGDDLIALADRAESLGATVWRLTRDQGIVIGGLSDPARTTLIEAAAGLGIPQAGSDIAACTGTRHCPIGITQSQALAEALSADGAIDLSGGLRLRVSGCQNSCGHHHVADIGLHGESRKIDGRAAPHYALHIGSRASPDLRFGVEGPSVPAAKVGEAVATVLASWRRLRHNGEDLHGWASRLGKDGLSALLSHVGSIDPDDPRAFEEPGVTGTFAPPKAAAGECAAPAVVAEYLADAAHVALDDIARARSVDDDILARDAAHDAAFAPIKRLLAVAGVKRLSDTNDGVAEQFRERFADRISVLAGFDRVLDILRGVDAGVWDGAELALAHWVSVAEGAAEEIIAQQVAEGLL